MRISSTRFGGAPYQRGRVARNRALLLFMCLGPRAPGPCPRAGRCPRHATARPENSENDRTNPTHPWYASVPVRAGTTSVLPWTTRGNAKHHAAHTRYRRRHANMVTRRANGPSSAIARDARSGRRRRDRPRGSVAAAAQERRHVHVVVVAPGAPRSPTPAAGVRVFVGPWRRPRRIRTRRRAVRARTR